MLDAFYQSLACFFIPYLVRETFNLYKVASVMVHPLSYQLFYSFVNVYLECFLLQAYQGSDIDIFSFGTPLNTISLFTILLHLSIEIKAWVSF